MIREDISERLYVCARPVTEILERASPSEKIGRRESQLLYGERFQPISQDGAYIHGISLSDGYEGFVEESALKKARDPANHYIAVPLSGIYPKADFKTRPGEILLMMARFFLKKEAPREKGFVYVDELGGWMFETHIAPIGEENAERDLSKTALEFISAPYLYAGRSVLGIDCSGLVQICMMRAGFAAPRDSDQQEAAIGQSVDFGDPLAPKNLKKNDLVFLKGHVGIMLDDRRFINATSRTMRVCVEDIKEVAACYEGGILSVKRLK